MNGNWLAAEVIAQDRVRTRHEEASRARQRLLARRHRRDRSEGPRLASPGTDGFDLVVDVDPQAAAAGVTPS